MFNGSGLLRHISLRWNVFVEAKSAFCLGYGSFGTAMNYLSLNLLKNRGIYYNRFENILFIFVLIISISIFSWAFAKWLHEITPFLMEKGYCPKYKQGSKLLWRDFYTVWNSTSLLMGLFHRWVSTGDGWGIRGTLLTSCICSLYSDDWRYQRFLLDSITVPPFITIPSFKPGHKPNRSQNSDAPWGCIQGPERSIKKKSWQP